MELILISSRKLKITLSAEDMEKYALSTDIDYADSKTRRAFKNILAEAREQTGFDTESEKIFIQLYPSKKGGCEVYITMLECEDSDSAEADKKSANSLIASRQHDKSTGIIATQKKKGAKERRRAYSFGSLESLISVCRRLLFVGWRGHSSAYKDNSGSFYIILKDKAHTDLIYLDRLSFVFEYGEAENYDSLIKYLGEHASCLCTANAVEKLGIL